MNTCAYIRLKKSDSMKNSTYNLTFVHLNLRFKKKGRGKHTASGLPMSLATEEVASERIEEVSTPSKFTFVEMLRHGIFPLCSRPVL